MFIRCEIVYLRYIVHYEMYRKLQEHVTDSLRTLPLIILMSKTPADVCFHASPTRTPTAFLSALIDRAILTKMKIKFVDSLGMYFA